MMQHSLSANGEAREVGVEEWSELDRRLQAGQVLAVLDRNDELVSRSFGQSPPTALKMDINDGLTQLVSKGR